MRILLANHHLQDRAGSELYTFELATGLAELGHEVAVFTFDAGDIAAELRERGVAVFTHGDEGFIERFRPEVAHVQHSPCLYYLGGLGLECPVVYSFLGVLPPLETPPLRWDGVAAWVGISEEVLEAMGRSPFGQAVPGTLVRNWFDDRRLVRPAAFESRPVRRVVVVTNHLADALCAGLDAVQAAQPDFSWQHLGYPDASVRLTADVLAPYDLVVTIGRTALLAAAVGKPVLLYDVHGSDGLLSAERFPVVARNNFSGRTDRHRPDGAELTRLLMEEAPRLDLEAAARVAWSEFALSQRLTRLVALYEDVVRTGPRLGPAVRATYGGAGLIHGELMRHVTRLRQVEQKFVRAEQERGGLEATVRTLRAQHQVAAAEQASLRRQLAEREAFLDGILTSFSWRGVEALRGLKDQLLPATSRRRQLYDRGLERLKRGFERRKIE